MNTTKTEPSEPVAGPVERPVSRLFADAIDADRLASGQAPKAPLTEARVFDDDIEVELSECEACGGSGCIEYGEFGFDCAAMHNGGKMPDAPGRQRCDDCGGTGRRVQMATDG